MNDASSWFVFVYTDGCVQCCIKKKSTVKVDC